jgi:hypothetical protein
VVGGRAEVIHVGREPIVTVRRDGDDVAVHVELADSCRGAARGEVRVDEEAERTWYIVPACVVVVPLLGFIVFGGGNPFDFCSYKTYPDRTRTVATRGVLWTEAEHHPCKDGAHEPAAGAEVDLELVSPGPEPMRWSTTTDAAGEAVFAGRAAEIARMADFCFPMSVVAKVAGDVNVDAERTPANQPDKPLSGRWPEAAQPLFIEGSGGAKDWRTLEQDSQRVVAGCNRDVGKASCEARFADAHEAWTRAGGTESCTQCLTACHAGQDACVSKCREDHPIRPYADLDETIFKECADGCAHPCGCACAAGPPPEHRCPQ